MGGGEVVGRLLCSMFVSALSPGKKKEKRKKSRTLDCTLSLKKKKKKYHSLCSIPGFVSE